MSLTLASIEARIKEYEAAIANSLSNHNGLLGGLGELKNLLSIVTPVADVLAPSAGAILGETETVVTDVDSALTPAPAEPAAA